MTRASGLPELRHKSQLCLTVTKVICGSWLKTFWHFDTWNQCWKQQYGEKSHNLAPQWHRGLRVYIYIWSIGDSWSKRSMSGRVAWNRPRWEREQSLHRNEWKVSAKPPIQAIMKECVFKMQSIRGCSWICAWKAWNCLSWLTAPLSNNYVKAVHRGIPVKM